jgi:DNA (cytosine-5)-methyltransferase 1
MRSCTRSRTRLAELRDRLMSRSRLSHGSLPVTSDELQNDPIRHAARSVGVEVALNLDEHWNVGRLRASDGAIDVIDMFSGCGGMSAGFVAVNSILPAYKHILAIDIDEVANHSYAMNIGTEPTGADISALRSDRKRLLNLVQTSGRRLDHPLVLIGCAPCQGFSSHRNALGEKDDRNSLFLDFARVATVLQPDAIVVENVPELLTSKYWHYVESARRLLKKQGYEVHLSVHNMAEFGVPQERFRALLLALRKPFKPIRGFLGRSQFRSVRSAIGHLPRIRAGQLSPNDSMHYTAGHHDSTLRVIRAVPKDGGSRPSHLGPQCLVRARERQGRGAYDDVYGRLYWDKPAITITAYARNPASGRFVHPEQNRGLSVREAAILQSFPSDYIFAGTFDQKFRQIGNAVPPSFSACLAMHLVGELLGPMHSGDMEDGIVEPIGASFSRLIPALKAGSLTAALRTSRSVPSGVW